MSLLSSITAMVTPVIVDRIAAAIGINSGLARTAINMALPAILGAFATKAATPSGAAALQSAVSNANPSLFGSLDSLLAGPKKDSFMASSSSALSDLLGSSTADKLVSSIASKSGLGGAAAAGLVPLVSQMALSGIAKTSGGSDANGLARMLAEDVRSFGASSNTSSPSPSSGPPSGMSGILKWAIPVVAVVAALWYFMSGPTQVNTPAPAPADQAAPAQQPAPSEQPATAEGGAITIDGIDVTKSITDVVGGLATTLRGVTDATTAQAALPKLQEFGVTVDKVASVATKFTPEQKTAVAGLISAALPAAKASAEKALAANGVGDLLKPVVDGLFAKLEGLAK
jgi:hypothetical protein